VKRTGWGLLLGGLGVAGLVLAVLNGHLRFVGIAAALVFFVLAASALSVAARIAGQLPRLVGKEIRVEVWGSGLEAAGPFTFVAVRVLGAGLHFYLRSTTNSESHDLKVAQPKSAVISDTRLEIGEAAYVSWAGHRLDRPSSGQEKALILSWPDFANT